MSKETFLFVGGPYDGQRIAVEHDVVRLPYPTKRAEQEDFTIESEAVKLAIYRRQLFHEADDKTLLSIYVHEGMERSVMKRLMECYKPQ